MSMKLVGGVETLGPASNPQKFQKEGSTQGCAQDIVEKDQPCDPERLVNVSESVRPTAQKCF